MSGRSARSQVWISIVVAVWLGVPECFTCNGGMGCKACNLFKAE